MGLMKKLTSALVASSLVFSLVGTAAAAYTPAAGETAGKRMQDLKILTGRPGEGLALNGEITRAELVTVIVRAFGKEADAQLLKGSTVFPDIQNHWASGNIAMAVALVEKAGSDPIGMPNGKFEPDAKLTAAQAVAFLMKFVGVKADASKTWPANYLDVAVEKNLITAEDKALIAPQLNENATRGLTFYLFDRAFYSYQLPTGKTFYTQFVDTMAPALTLNAVDATTIDSKVTVTGNVKDATSLYVGTAMVTPDATGNFSATYDLPELKDYTITVTARDLAGNTTEKSLKVTRAAGTAAAIEASDITVAAGGTVEVKAVVKDAKGNVITAPVSGTSTVGTYADGKFTAGTAVGAGTLVLKAGDVTKEVKVTVAAGALASITPSKKSVAPGEYATFSAKDAAGNVIASGVTYTLSSADASIDANGRFIGSKAGNYTVTATQGAVSVTGKIGVYGEGTKLAVSAPATMTANVTKDGAEYDDGTLYDVTVSFTDENGNVDATISDLFVMIEEKTGLAIFDADEDVVDPAVGLELKNGSVTFKVGVEDTFDGTLFEIRAYNILNDDYEAEELEATVETTGAERVAKTLAWDETVKTISSVNDAGKDLKLVVKDQDGVVMANASYDANIVITGAAGVEEATDKEETVGVGEFFTIVPSYGATGTVTITATVDGIGTVEMKPVLAVPGDAKSLNVVVKNADGDVVTTGTAGKTYTVEISTLDEKGVETSTWSNGHDIADEAPVVDVTFGSAVLDYVTFSNDLTDLGDDKYEIALDTDGTASFTVTVTQFTSTLPIKIANSDVTTGTASIAFKADSAAKIALTTNNDHIMAPATDDVRMFVPVTAPSFNLSAQVLDANNNKVAKAGVKVVFSAYAADAADVPDIDENTAKTSDVKINGKSKTYTATTDENGVATVKIEAVADPDVTYAIVLTPDTDSDLVVRAASASRFYDRLTFQVAERTVKTVETFLYRPGTKNTVTTIVNPETDMVEIWAKVTNNYGRPFVGAADYLRLNLADAILYNAAGTDDQFTKNEWAGASSTDLDELSYTWVAAEDDGWYFLSDDGTTPAEVNIAKAGTQNIVVEYKGAQTAVAGSKTVVVKAAPLAGFVVVDKDGNEIAEGDDVTIDAKKVVGPFTLKLADMFGNTLTTSATTEVSVVSDTTVGTGTIGVRVGQNDTNTDTIKTRASQTFYLSASKAGEYDVTFSVGAHSFVLHVVAE